MAQNQLQTVSANIKGQLTLERTGSVWLTHLQTAAHNEVWQDAVEVQTQLMTVCQGRAHAHVHYFTVGIRFGLLICILNKDCQQRVRGNMQKHASGSD